MAVAAGGHPAGGGPGRAALSPGTRSPSSTLALALLGLGWNFGLISGTALIVDATPVETRARTQGSVDVLIAISGAGGGALSGMVVDGVQLRRPLAGRRLPGVAARARRRLALGSASGRPGVATAPSR